MSFSKRCQNTEEKRSYFGINGLLKHIPLYQNTWGRSDIAVFEPVDAFFFHTLSHMY